MGIMLFHIGMVIISFMLGVCSFTISCLIMAPGEILSWYARILYRLPEWIGKPLGLCEKCLGGQFALWLFPLWVTRETAEIYSPILHIVFVLLTIFFSALIKAVFLRLNGTVYQPPRKKSGFIPPELENPNE